MDDERRPSDMAKATDDGKAISKGSKIWVVVEEALVDVIVVSFKSGEKTFQGVLLDITKKNSPFGIVHRPNEDPFTQFALGLNKEKDQDENKLHSVSQRYTYFQQENLPHPNQKKNLPRQTRDQNVRMRRLRPRQVLCSHCRKLCIESVNVQSGNVSSTTKYMATRYNRINSTDRNQTENHNNNTVVIKQEVDSEIRTENEPSLIECPDTKIVEDDNIKQCDSVEAVSCGDGNSEYQAVSSSELSNRMVLRKRKLPGNVGDDIEFTKQRKTEVLTDNNTNNDVRTCPVIKISYANPQGKDTVLKIPTRLASGNEDDAVWCDNLDDRDADAKSAKKALKKAKRDAHRKSWCESIENGNNLEKNRHHHHHHHHKHKIKRKRKHREFIGKDNGSYDSENIFRSELESIVDGEQPAWSLCSTDNSEDVKEKEVFLDDVKTNCLKQKLSISLRRLSAKAYMRCSPKYANEDSNLSFSTTSSDSECGDVPDFPKHEPLRDSDKIKPLTMRINAHNVKKCLLDNDREMSVGDVVWGKIQGFPWWPGKVLALTVSQRDNGATLNHQAHVAWFGSSTSSYMSCSQLTPFLDDFKLRYNRKKRGSYKEAIRQATIEAHHVPDILGEEEIA